MDKYDYWLWTDIGALICPICERMFRVEEIYVPDYRYCPFCGNRFKRPKELES